MFSLKKTKKEVYRTPLSKVSEVDLEGIICTSAYKKVNVDQLHNINADPEYASEPLYFD